MQAHKVEVAGKGNSMLHVLASTLHKETLKVPTLDDQFVKENQVVAVMTGGSEQLFLQKIQTGELTLTQPIYLIAGSQSNSLAACCEILSWINLHGGVGRLES